MPKTPQSRSRRAAVRRNPSERIEIEAVTDPQEVQELEELGRRERGSMVPLRQVLERNGYELVKVDD
ncbi:MAG: hypothetical protein SGI92_02010 [Bryobacteraceae bacterium]|nr:hypothetical protein [Bryobacteraceae bacterium]